MCSKPAHARCGGCKSRLYCDRACQASDRRAHKSACKAIATSSAAVAVSAGAVHEDIASVERGEWVCVGCSKVVTIRDDLERCEGCLSKYCSGRCRMDHWAEHKATCIPAAVARIQAGEGQMCAMEAPLVYCLALARQEKGDDHDDTLEAMGDLAHMLLQEGKYREAEALDREELERWQRL